MSWFRDTGYAQLIEEIDKTEGSKPIAVIFNLGVNDLGNAGNYVSYMTNIASTLKSKNCKLFYMSVNPINSTMITKAGRKPRTEAQVREFNSKIRSGLSLDYKYIDMYSVLMKKATGPMPAMMVWMTAMTDFTTQQRHSRGSTITALLISTQEVSTHLIINGITDRKSRLPETFRQAGFFCPAARYFLSDRAITPCTNHENSLYLIRYGRLEVRRDV